MKFVIEMISRGEIKTEGRCFLNATSKQKVRKLFNKQFPSFKIVSLKENKGLDECL